MTEPRGVDLHHARRAERLHVAVDSANQHEEPKQAPKRGDTERHVHDDRARRSDQHRAFSAEAVGQETVDNQTTGIGEQRSRDDRADLRLTESQLIANLAARQR